MSAPLQVPVCDDCGTARWPPRVRCAVCGGAHWTPGDGSRGRVEQATDVAGDPPARLATVRLDAGPVVITRAPGLAEGDRALVVRDDHGALDARPEPAEGR